MKPEDKLHIFLKENRPTLTNNSLVNANQVWKKIKQNQETTITKTKSFVLSSALLIAVVITYFIVNYNNPTVDQEQLMAAQVIEDAFYVDDYDYDSIDEVDSLLFLAQHDFNQK